METVQTANPPSFESVWALLQENAKQQAEWQKEAERRSKALDRQIGKLGNRFGEVIEYMVAPDLCEKFKKLGLNFQQSNTGTIVKDYDNDIFFEVDIKLENGDKALLVEVKSKLTTEDVQEHIERLEKMRKYADLHGDRRAFLGAVAGIVMTPNVIDYALRQGFYVLEPAGDVFRIIPPSGEPREW